MKKLIIAITTILTAIASYAQPGKFDIKRLKPIYQQREANASPQVKQLLSERRKFVSDHKLSITVVNTSVAELKITEIAGSKEMPKSDAAKYRLILKDKTLSPEALAVLKSVKIKPNPSAKSYDARKANLLPVIRSQPCANCWSYAVMGAVEASYIKNIGVADPSTINFSERQLMNCGSSGDCSGGWTYIAFDWLKTSGNRLLSENDLPDYKYPPIRKNNKPSPTCPYYDKTPSLVHVIEWGAVDPSGDLNKIASVESIKQALCTYGPISADMYATNYFQTFGGDVVYYEYASNPDAPKLNHSIMIVGWDDNKNAWLVRNSWRTAWGDDGYAWVDYHTNDIGQRAIWVIARNVPPPIRTH